MVRTKLLKLDHPTETSGKIYSKTSVRQWIKSDKRPKVIYGEFGQPDLKALVKDQKTSVDHSNVCVKFMDFRVVDDYLTANYIFCRPLGKLLFQSVTNADGEPDFRMRGYARSRTEGNKLVYDVVDIVAFDAVTEKGEHQND